MPSRLTFTTTNFRCHLTCGRCTFLRAGGVRCKNRVCFGTPICWTHTRQLYGVRLGMSTLPGAGKGLFNMRTRKKGDWLCPYGGEEITSACVDQRYPLDATAPYAVDGDDGNFRDAACARGIGAMANGRFRANGYSLPLNRHNAVIEDRDGGAGAWIRATRRIRANAEIFVYYGDAYVLENNHETRRRSGNDTRPC